MQVLQTINPETGFLIIPNWCRKLGKWRRNFTTWGFEVVLFLLPSLVTAPSSMSIPSLVLESWQFLFVRDWPNIRHFSHVTESRIFKNCNLRKKADRNFRDYFLKNHFRLLRLYSNPTSWLARSCCHMGTSSKTKDWSSRF